MQEFMIWVENIELKKCRTCRYASYQNGDDKIQVCGYHSVNFSIDSSCEKWEKSKDYVNTITFKRDY